MNNYNKTLGHLILNKLNGVVKNGQSRHTAEFLKRFGSCQTFGLTRGQVLSVRIIFAIFINMNHFYILIESRQ
jgi:hypothetical protein